MTGAIVVIVNANCTHTTSGKRSCGLPKMGQHWTAAWINRKRRLAKDFEATIESVEAFLYAASTMLLLRRLARS